MHDEYHAPSFSATGAWIGFVAYIVLAVIVTLIFIY